MNFIDIVVLVAIGFGAFRGFKNGIVIEIAGLLGLVIGIWAGLRLAFIFANYYRDNIEIPSNYIPLLAFLTAFFLGIGAVYLSGRILNKVVNSLALGIPNRLVGSAFGVAKWAFLIGTGLSLIGNSKIISQTVVDDSTAYPLVVPFSKVVQDYTVGLIPAASNVLKDVDTYFLELDSTGTDADKPLPTPEETEPQPTEESQP